MSTRVDVRVTCDVCNAELAHCTTGVAPHESSTDAGHMAASLASLVRRAMWDAVRQGARLTPTSTHCNDCARSIARTAPHG